MSGSDSDSDDFGLQQDMEALRRACSVTGAALISDDSSSDSGDEDRELYRKIQERFSVTNDAEEPLNLKPICVLPPPLTLSDSDVDDCDGDFEILRAIQSRFSDYNKDDLNESTKDGLQKSQVGASIIDSEKETSNNLFSRTNIAKEFPDSVDSCITGNFSEPPTEIAHENQVSDKFDNHLSCDDNIALTPVEDSAFPKSAQAFLDAIKKNRSCQKYLRSKLIQIESRIEENTKLRNSIKALKGFQFCCRRRTGLELSQKKDARLQLIQVPKLRVDSKAKEKNTQVMYYGPPDNSHVPNYKAVLHKFSDSFNRDKWTEDEDINLVKGIKQQFQDMLLQKTYQNEEILRQRSTGLVSDVEGFPGESNNFDSIIASISDHDITDENMREFLPKVNWEQLASMYTKRRSGAECEARWLNFTDPLINKNPWTKTEEKKLLYIIQQKGINNWINIALSLGTNRTPFQCLAHYQRSLNPSILKREWTEDEDDKLRAAVATYGERNWQSVASVLEGRTGTQCSNRWIKSLHPMRKKKGKWSPNEDKRLKVAVMFFGEKNWRNIAQYVPGRDHVQCRERWKNCLDPSVKLDEWSEEEDLRLKEAFEEHGPSWNKIASYVSQRTDNQCLRRWKTLFPHEVPRFQAASRIKKVALISNFVDREARRPALGPSDFVQLQLLDSVTETGKTDSCRKGEKKSSYVAKLRSAKRKADAERSCESVLRLTNGKKRRFNAKKSSTQDQETASVKGKLSEVNSVAKSSAHDVHTARKQAPGRKRKKLRTPDASQQAATGVKEHTSKPSSCENECVDTTNKEVGSLSEVDATKNKKSRKHIRKKNKLMEQVNEAQVHTGTDGIDVSKKSDALETCSSDHAYLAISEDCPPSPRGSPERMLINGDVAEPFVRDSNDERPPRCPTPDILDNLNLRAFTVSRKVVVNRSRHRGRTLKQRRNADYEDDMTLAAFINQSRKARKILLSSIKASKPLPKCIDAED
ncbi:uncharacterized protein LOC108209447 isoform X2 [Daucus carota subsp. sativus]|uniref:uncharacterized protein LOC108209447 isoform X2 n=1 Tax=Daucus carota subsp. sativus TaxID=79200 RepID=UPI0007F02919|nr:PREDICTED: uncharacterized protein LOC108209447 isoform X2 [Daucus carota subsp. sativus]